MISAVPDARRLKLKLGRSGEFVTFIKMVVQLIYAIGLHEWPVSEGLRFLITGNERTKSTRSSVGSLLLLYGRH